VWWQIWETILTLSHWEWLAFLFGLMYVFLAARNYISCWIFGILSSGIWTAVSFYDYQLYMDSGLNFFYVIMGIVGWINWGKSGGDPTISFYSGSFHIRAIIILLGLSVLAAVGLEYWTDAALPYWDATTTVFSIWATYLLIKHKKENWLYWIVTDAVYIGLYAYKGAYLFALLFIIYTIISVKGWFEWNSADPNIE